MDIMQQWKKERNKVIKSLDVKKFKKFYNKWMAKGIYYLDLPQDDRVVEVSLYKMLYHLKCSTPEEKDKAAAWLSEHGCTTDL